MLKDYKVEIYTKNKTLMFYELGKKRSGRQPEEKH